jgi:hypothetical protein
MISTNVLARVGMSQLVLNKGNVEMKNKNVWIHNRKALRHCPTSGSYRRVVVPSAQHQSEDGRLAEVDERRMISSHISNNKENNEKVQMEGEWLGHGAAVAMLSALLLFGSVVEPEAALAARSGGRVGGSSGFSSRRSAPRAAPGPSVRNYNYYSAPPLVSPYGFGMPFFGGGIVAPFPLFGIGSLFNILFLLFMVNVVVNVISSFTNSRGRNDDDDDERW